MKLGLSKSGKEESMLQVYGLSTYAVCHLCFENGFCINLSPGFVFAVC